MLAEVPRQILHFLAELKKFANAMLPEVQTCILKLPRERVLGIRVFPGAHETGQAVQSFGVEGKDFSNFASGGLAAIGDDVRGHRRSQLSVAFVDILDHPFPLVATREVEINVRPFPALFGKEPFKEKIHSHGIDGGDSQGITDRAVGRGTSALHENVLFPAEANDVPDDEEIAGEVEFLDHRQFVLDLPGSVLIICAIALDHAFQRAFAKKGDLRFVVGRRIAGKLVAKILQGKQQARGKHCGVPDGFGQVCKEHGHLRRGLEIAFAVGGEKASGV